MRPVPNEAGGCPACGASLNHDVVVRERDRLLSNLNDAKAAISRAHRYAFEEAQKAVVRELTAYRATIASTIGPLNIAVDRCVDRVREIPPPKVLT